MICDTAKRKDLELVMRYSHEQRLVKCRLEVEEMFRPSRLDLIETGY